MILITSYLLCAFVTLSFAELHHTRTLHGDYDLSWGVVNDELEIKIVANTTGWVAFGVSPNGGMAGADIVMGWIEADGKPNFSDRHVGSSNGVPQIDAKQSYQLLELTTQNGQTTLHFKRPLDTCDDDDFLLRGTARVIYAFGTEKPINGVPAKHLDENRGTKSIDLLQGEPPSADLPDADVKTVDFVFDKAIIPAGEHTRYWVRALRWPTAGKAHLIRAEPVIPAGEELAMHHILVYACNNILPEHLDYVGDGYSRMTPQALRECNFVQPVAAWAVGGVGNSLPKDVGIPLGEPNSSQFLMIEVHYDLPDKQQHITSGGIRLYYTEKLRPIDAGIMNTGHKVDQYLLFPPLDEDSKRLGICDGSCTKQYLPKDGINVFATMLHMHTAGVAITTQHIAANGTELEPLAVNEHYDFNLQTVVFKETPRRVMPGDTLRTTCTFNGRGRSRPTFGGLGTNDEMCLTYAMYYPRTPLLLCLSSGSTKLLTALALDGAFGPVRDISLAALLNTSDWSRFNPSYDRIIAEGKQSGLLTSFCNGVSTPLANDASPLVPYVAPDKCASAATTSTIAGATTVDEPAATTVDTPAATTADMPASTSLLTSTDVVRASSSAAPVTDPSREASSNAAPTDTDTDARSTSSTSNDDDNTSTTLEISSASSLVVGGALFVVASLASL